MFSPAPGRRHEQWLKGSSLMFRFPGVSGLIRYCSSSNGDSGDTNGRQSSSPPLGSRRVTYLPSSDKDGSTKLKTRKVRRQSIISPEMRIWNLIQEQEEDGGGDNKENCKDTSVSVPDNVTDTVVPTPPSPSTGRRSMKISSPEQRLRTMLEIEPKEFPSKE